MPIRQTCALTLFGPPRLTGVDGRDEILPKKAFWLALRLIVEAPGLRMERDEAAAFLWPHQDLDGRQANLRTLIKRTRASQDAASAFPFIVEAKTLHFDAGAANCDAFSAFAAIKSGNIEELARLAPVAARPLLEGCEDESPESGLWLNNVRAQFVADYSRLARRQLARPARGDDAAARRSLAIALIAFDACDEDAYRALISLSAARGDLDELRATYDQLARTLKRRDGRAPSNETRALRDLLMGPAAAARRRASVSHGAERLPPLLLASTRPVFGSGVDPAGFPRLVESLAAQLWRARAVRVAVYDPTLPAPDPEPHRVYRIHLALRQAAATMLTARLTWEATSEVVWVKTFALTPETVEPTCALLASATLTKIEQHQIALSEGAAESDLSTFLLLAKANRDLMKAELPSIRRARRRFREVWRADPTSARAYAGAARSFWIEWLLRAGPDPALLDTAQDLAQRAIAADGDDPNALRELGMVASYGRRHDAALESLSRAVALAPDEIGLRNDYADALVSYGLPEEALRQLEIAERQTEASDDFGHWIAGTALYLTGRYAAALAKIDAMQVQDNVWRLQLACHAMLGQGEEARMAAAKSRDFNPDFDPESWSRICPISRTLDRDHILEGFRLAGLLRAARR